MKQMLALSLSQIAAHVDILAEKLKEGQEDKEKETDGNEEKIKHDKAAYREEIEWVAAQLSKIPVGSLL